MRRVESRQMQLAFADSPRGGGDAFAFDVSEGTAYLLHTAGAIGRRETTAGGTTAKRLLEEAMLPSNLAAQWHDHARTSPRSRTRP